MSPRPDLLVRELPPGWRPSEGHGSTLKNACVMDAASWLVGTPEGELIDDHECVCPVIGAFMRSWNDALGDGERGLLTPYVRRLPGTRSTPEVESARAWLATDWLVRECAPAWLRLAGLNEHAQTLERLAVLDSNARAGEAQSVLSAACSTACSTAYSAVYSAAYSTAYSAACSAVYSAACAAASSALDPTHRGLQQSALRLLGRMIEVQA